MFKKQKKFTKKEQVKRSYIKGICVVIPFIIAIVLVYQFVALPKARHNARQDAIKEFDGNTKERKVCVLNKDIEQGHAIDVSKDLSYINMPIESIPNNSISDPILLKNMMSKIKLNKNIVVTSNMFYKNEEYVTSDLRNQDYSYIQLNKNLKAGDYVDIRYKKKDGTDYVVLAKKKILELNGSVIVLNITEEERTYMNNATVVADYTGGAIYTTIYVDPANQEKATVTYLLDDSVEKLIKDNPNAVKQSGDNMSNRDSTASSTQTAAATASSTQTADTKPQFVERSNN